MFKEKNDLTINKISNIFDYYLKLIFKYVKEDIQQYQEKKSNKDDEEEEQQYQKYLDEKIIKKLDEIFDKKDIIITKDLLATALRLFISIVLYREKDKENKIQQNTKNIIEYLKEKDLWKKIDIKDDKFIENLIAIKSLNIKIKEILWLYFYLINNKDEDFEKDVKEYLKNKIEINKPVESDDDGETTGITRRPGRRPDKNRKNRINYGDESDNSEKISSDSDSESNGHKNKTNKTRRKKK